jgi:4-amino-4-deoxy-L-arabinose transferase-like glycosyltransferase
MPGSGIPQAAMALLSHHSPLSSLAAATGFAIFGPNDWAPYLVNGVLLGLTFFAVLRFLAHEGTPFLVAALTTACLSLIPFFQTAVTEFRPDLFQGVLVAFAVLGLFKAPIFSASWLRQVRLGLLFGIALLAKPAAFLAAGFVISFAVIASTLAFLFDNKRDVSSEIGPIATSYAYLFLGTAAVFVPYLAISASYIFAYMAQVLVLEHRRVGVQRGLRSTGPLLLDRRGRRCGALLLAPGRTPDLPCTNGCGGPHTRQHRADNRQLSVPDRSLRSRFFNAAEALFPWGMFYATFSLVMARDWSWLFLRVPKRIGSLPAHGTLAVVFCVAYLLTPRPILAVVFPPQMVEAGRAATLDAWTIILDAERRVRESGRGTPLTVLVNSNDTVNAWAIELEARRGQLNVRFQYGDFATSAADFVAMARSADLVIVTQSPQSFLPGAQLGDAFSSGLQAAGFKVLASIDGRGLPSSQVFAPPS